MDWFERLTGFRESSYADTRARIKVEGRELQSLVNGKSYGIGELELVSLQSLRERVGSLGGPAGRLAADLNRPVEALWKMTNGYALCTRVGLDAIAEHLKAMRPDQLDTLSGRLRVGVHSGVEVTDVEVARRPRVSQVFCSALPITYSRVPSAHWKPFASLVLEAAYEATLLAAILNKQRGMSNVVLLTHLGGGPLATRTGGLTLPSVEL